MASDTAAGPSLENNATSLPCVTKPTPFEATVTLDVGMHYHHTPAGGATWDGAYFDINWSADPAWLVDLTITAQWDSQPGNPDLRVGVLNPESWSFAEHWLAGPANGASPLVLTSLGPLPNYGRDLFQVDLGTSQTPRPPLTSTVILLPQEVHVTVQETYSCGAPAL